MKRRDKYISHEFIYRHIQVLTKAENSVPTAAIMMKYNHHYRPDRPIEADGKCSETGRRILSWAGMIKELSLLLRKEAQT